MFNIGFKCHSWTKEKHINITFRKKKIATNDEFFNLNFGHCDKSKPRVIIVLVYYLLKNEIPILPPCFRFLQLRPIFFIMVASNL